MTDLPVPPRKPVIGNERVGTQSAVAIYQAVLSSVGEGFCLIDVLLDEAGQAVDYRVLETNPAFEKQTGLANAVGKTARELPLNLTDGWLDFYGRVAASGEPARVEQWSDALDGWLELFATRVGDAASHWVAVIFTNISDRKRRLEAGATSDTPYRQLADALPQLVWTTRPDGQVDYVNQRWLEYTGVSPQEVGSRGWEDAVYAEDLPQVDAAWRQARLCGEPFELKLRYRQATGDWRWHLLRGLPAKDDDGRVSKWLATTTDIHDSEMREQDHGFLSNLSERLRLASDVEQLLAEVPSAVGPYLGLSRCCFVDISERDDRWTVRQDYSRGLSSWAGEYPLSLYGTTMLRELRSGKTHAIDDALADPRTAEHYARAYEPHGIRAQATVPFLRDGQWTSSLIAATTAPHAWHGRERVLLETVAERTWNVLETMRLATALRRSESLYRSVVELAPDGIYLAEQTGKFIDVNPAGAALLGYTCEELVQKSVSDIVRPGEGVRLQALLHALASGQHRSEEWELRHKDGHYVPLELSQRFTPDGRWQAIGRDVSERRRVQARQQFLLRLQDEVREFTDPTAIMAAATSLLGRHLGVGRCAYADVDPDGDHFTVPYEYAVPSATPPLAGRWSLDAFGPHVAAELRAGHTLVVRDYQRDVPADAPAFTVFGIRATICAAALRDGRLTAMMAVHQAAPHDWTADEIELVELVADRCWDSIERARALRVLQASETRFRALVEQATVGIARVDLTGAFTLVNPRFCETVGYTEAELIGGMRMQDITHPDDLALALERFNALAEGGPDFTIERRYVRQDGGEVWVSDTVSAVRAPDGTLYGLMALTLDITGRKQVEAELRAASRMRDEFLATLSHELRTPLNAVLGWTHMIRTGALRKDVEARAFDSLERNARAQAQLVDDLLDVSRIISGRLQLASEDIDLAGVIAGAVETVQPAALAKRVRLMVDVDPDQSVVVNGDADRLRQVVWNLLSNAVKFTPAEGEVGIRLERQGASAVIVVRDTGPGIEAEFLPFVFERFRQADSTTTRRHGGLGLGLAIVRHLTEAHGGTVAAASEPGGGATFTIRLPLRSVAAALPAPPLVPPGLTPGLNGIRALVVADDPDASDLLCAMIESWGAVVTGVEGSAAALAALAGAPFDLLVVDSGDRPDDGLGLIRAIRADRRGPDRVPAVFVTALASARDREQSFQAGFDLHYAKPLDAEQFVRGAAAVARSRLG